MEELEGALRLALGLGQDEGELGVVQMALRAVVVYVVALTFVRLGKKRFLGRATAFDVIVGIMLGSIASRAITGNAPFVPALAAAGMLVAMHWLLSGLALGWDGFGRLVKGSSRLLVKNGVVDRRQMRAAHITDRDLMEDLRSQGVDDLDGVREARLERSGKLSLLKAERAPRVLEIKVERGIETVRIELT